MPADTDPAAPIQRSPAVRHVRALLFACATIAFASPAPAAMYKCHDASGRTTYTDRPCSRDARPWTPKRRLNTVSRESLTGAKSEPVARRPEWLRPIDPVGDCRRRGGRIDRELRACIVP